jgi:hypothetical protein
MTSLSPVGAAGRWLKRQHVPTYMEPSTADIERAVSWVLATLLDPDGRLAVSMVMEPGR